MKKTIRTAWTLLLCLCVVASLCTAAFGTYLPDVTAEMTESTYWSNLQPAPNAVLMTQSEIAQRNAESYAASGTGMYDLKNLPATINGVSQRDALLSSGRSDANYYLGWTYESSGKKADQAFYETMVQNMIDPNAQTAQPIRYAIAVNRTTLHTFPSNEQILDDPADPDFDYQHLAAVRVNEPLAIYGRSADGAFYLVRSVCCSGWIPAEDVAVCSDKAEWLSAWDFPAEETLVIWGTYTTAYSNFAPSVSNRLLTQGTTLQRVELPDRNTLVNNRAAYHNHVVYLPVRNADGSYSKMLCLIAEHAEASTGYLPMTQANIAKVAFSLLGDAYGWGGMLMAEDCSGYIRDVYKCFGLELARNTTWQQKMPVYQKSISGLTAEQKTEAIRALPLGATLYFSGHEMMYLGCVDGKLYVVSAVSSIMNPDVSGRRQRARDVMINTLELKRANGNTWLSDLNAVSVAYYPVGANLLAEFSDVPADAWYHGAVRWAVLNGITQGTGEGVFSPNEECTRAQAVTFLWREAGEPVPTAAQNPFRDVADDAWYHDAVLWAVEQGITVGTSPDTFEPDGECTRAQIVTFLYRAASSPQTSGTVSFVDVAEDAWYADAVRWAVKNAITQGTGDGCFSPDATCTRAEIVTFLYRKAA